MKTGISWDETADVVIVGFGGAGACAAIEAADQGLDVKVFDRFNGGGATRNSGGIIYAGGGTSIQEEADIHDSPQNMYNYLKEEIGDAVSEKTLREFCKDSPSMIQWLITQGVQFEATLCPSKTSYPPKQYYLYYSGNELVPPFSQRADPMPRGHRPKGAGLSGAALFSALKSSAMRKGVRVSSQSKGKKLIINTEGKIEGLVYNSLDNAPIIRFIHRLLSGAVNKARYLSLVFPEFNSLFAKMFNYLERFGKTKRIQAVRGVILAAGGFIYNREMVRQYAPKYLPGTPLGTLGDDGSGIQLGVEAGGDVRNLSRVSTWRFITPPESLVKGILVDDAGKRFSNEERYGAQLGDEMVNEHRGRAWLIIDHQTWRTAFYQIISGGELWFQILLGLVNLYINRKNAQAIRNLARKIGIDPDSLTATINLYNQNCFTQSPDLYLKSLQNQQPLTKPPYFAINCSLNNRIFPCATLTLGGLEVDEATSLVKRKDGTTLSGLYAVGRTAAGIPSNGYVSGLAISHCIFSGRQAGRHIATGKPL